MRHHRTVKKSGACIRAAVMLSIFTVAATPVASSAAETGLLFHLSGDNGFTADHAEGDPEPTFLNDVEIVPDGARGPGFSNAHISQLFAFDAPGNMYAQRGTFAFFWRPRDPVGETPFHIVQAGPSDHSDLVMTWLRIDYNGRGGFDAFVTDINLACLRVSHDLPTPPAADEWRHLALAWDETVGVRLYVDGRQVAKMDTVTVLYSGLDQFGTGGRGVTPHFVGSEGNFVRGGDHDEFRIYDRMLPPEQVARIARGESTEGLEPIVRRMSDPVVRDEWRLRYGWNRPGDIPPEIPREVRVRKLEMHEVRDLKQWWWKGNDGIRETTWPSIYNRSRIPGRLDYIIQPDWNCYSLSGQSVTFTMPDEPFNHIEIAGAAFGAMTHLGLHDATHTQFVSHLFRRPEHQERTVHRLDRTMHGGMLRFDNDVQETPIGELMVYNVTGGREPVGTTTLHYSITGAAEPDYSSLDGIVNYIEGRYMPDERSIMTALPSNSPMRSRSERPDNPLPLVHVLIPFELRGPENPIISLGWYRGGGTRTSYTWENMHGGLDGIAVDLPAFDLAPTHDGLIPMNIQVKDPIWPARNLIDFTFSVKPGGAKTVFLDTRDRILPNGYPLYFSIASASGDFGEDDLEGAGVRLIFKDYDEAAKEHEIDRFTQVRDNAAHMVEPGANSKKYRVYRRFSEDMADLFRVNPHHERGRDYWYWRNGEQSRPPFVQPEPPAGIPLWAFRQLEDLKLVKQFVMWWIDNRQIENGEFGGGLSDDGDMTHSFVGPALMGVDPDKITDSIRREMDAFYANGMFADGLPTIQTDELHTYEEGAQVLPQDMQLAYGDPKAVERLMETARGYTRITGVNSAGHRHFRSSFYSATKLAEEGLWAYSYPYSYLILHPGLVLVEFNGNPAAKKVILELADGLLAHRRKDGNGRWVMHSIIDFNSDEDRPYGVGPAAHVFWAAWRWTGDDKYLDPILDMGRGALGTLNANLLDLLDKRGTWGEDIAESTGHTGGSALYRHIAWQMTGDTKYLEGYYADQIASAARSMYINTEAEFWIDRVGVRSHEIQRSRLGGVSAYRGTIYPGHAVSWRFAEKGDAENVAVLVPKADTETIDIIAFNTRRSPVSASMTAWDIVPGTWEVTVSRDLDGDHEADETIDRRTVTLEKTGAIDLIFPSRETTMVSLTLKRKGTPVWERTDLGIGREDIDLRGGSVAVTVHNLSSVKSPEAVLALVDGSGAVTATAAVPPLEAPVDLVPRTVTVEIELPANARPADLRAVLDPEREIEEITRLNNEIPLGR